MKEFYDSKNKRLVFVGKESDSSYWDKHWASGGLKPLTKVKNNFVTKYTKKYIKPGRDAKVLEGGCGRAENVYSLGGCGYDTYGVDYAKTTIENIKQTNPELNVSLCDVRSLSFDDNYFDGYWSLGVIEHFYGGYQDIVDEARRVIKKGGFLFLTVPTISILRRQRIKKNTYPIWADNRRQEDFFQFAFNKDRIISDFTNKGFSLLKEVPLDGVKGFKDEVKFLRPVLQYIYDSPVFVIKILKKIIDLILRGFSNHISLFIFLKN